MVYEEGDYVRECTLDEWVKQPNWKEAWEAWRGVFDKGRRVGYVIQEFCEKGGVVNVEET